LREQVEIPAQQHELPTDVSDADAIVLAEVGNRLEVRCQPASQPHQLNVALGFALQAATRLNAVQVAVNVELQQIRRMVCGTASVCRRHTFKSQRRQVQLIDKDVDHPYRILFRHVVIKLLRKQDALCSVAALDEPLHSTPRRSCEIAVRQSTLKFVYSKPTLLHIDGRVRSRVCQPAG
jgi:hypothetical protein